MKILLGPRLGKAMPRLAVGLVVVAVLAAHAASVLQLPYLARIEMALYDARLRLSAPGGVDPRIVILDIDETSLKERENGGEGRWPWPRDRMALLVTQAFEKYGLALMGFDVVFAERDETSGIRVLDRLAQKELKDDGAFRRELHRLRPSLDFDQAFAAAIEDNPVVLGLTFLSAEEGNTAPKKGGLPDPILTTQALPLAASAVKRWQGYTGNLASLQKAAAAAGHFNPLMDDDGSVRRIPMLVEYGGGYHETLALAMARVLSGGEPIKAILGDGMDVNTFGALEWLEVGGMQIPVDEEIASLVPYRGPYRSFQYISAADVIHGRLPPKALEGKIAFVGTSAPGLLDLRTTPMGSAYPGVEIHANMLAGILDGTIKQKPAYAIGADVLLIVLLGGLLAMALPFLGPLGASIMACITIGGAVALNLLAFTQAHLLLPLANLLAALVTLYLFNMAYGFFFEAKNKRQMTGLFGQYVPPELVDEMAKDPGNYSLRGESRDLTILFSDVRGFTTISESLDPKELSDLMNAFLSPLSQVIYEQRGTIDKYMGDCIMAFWGAPMRDDEHARHGVQAAFKMLQALERLKSEFESRGWPEIHIGVGLNSGKVSVGNMGSKIRVAYTVMGDAVNLASRLEGITKEYGARIVIGESTRALIPDLVCRELDRVRVKGKDIAVAIFEPIGFEADVDSEKRSLVEAFHHALQLYRDQRWGDAASAFNALLAKDPAGRVLYQLYLDRIEHLRLEPPPSPWDGAYTFKTK